MAITYPVDVQNTKWSLYQVDTAEILPPLHRTWPIADGSEIPGLDENLVYLLETSDASLDADRRLYTIVTTKNIDAAANVIHTSFETEKRPVDEIITAIENEEMSQLGKHVSIVRELIRTRLAVSAIFEFVEGQAYPPKVQVMVDKYKASGVKLWKNSDRKDALKDDAANDRDVLIDEGWEAP